MKINNTCKTSPYLDMGQLRNCTEPKKRYMPDMEVQSSLQEEIQQLQKQLQDQSEVHSTLEKALSDRSFIHVPIHEYSNSKPATDLIKDIANLELEVLYLEKYLLSMYRRAFAKRWSFLSEKDARPKTNLATHEWMFPEKPENYITTEKKSSIFNSACSQPSESSVDNLTKGGIEACGMHTLDSSGIHRSHSSLSQRSGCPLRTSLPFGAVNEAVQSCYSLPLTMLERTEESFSNVSLGEHLRVNVSGHIWETPNWLSEEMIKCISTIYYHLAEPSLSNHASSSSPMSFSSSRSGSPRSQPATFHLQRTENPSFHACLDNQFYYDQSQELDTSYLAVVEVQGISRDSHNLHAVEGMLGNFRSLVSMLEQVNSRKMKHEEKLAFWINVHNALVMHAFLVFGIPKSSLRRTSLLLKAAYNVGGQKVSVDMIQSSIMGCRLPRPGQWLQSLLFPKARFKARDYRKSYAIEHPEPRLHFALCSGSHSDPVVRMYTPKRIFEELEVAKEEYIQSNIRIYKEQKLQLPKNLDIFVKESGLCPSGLVETIEHCMPDWMRKRFQPPQEVKFSKKIEWIPHNFTFRYLISSDLAK